MSAGFDDLSEKFSEDELLGEVLGAHHNPICVPPATCKRKKKHENEQYEDRLRVSGQMPNLNHKGHEVSRSKPQRRETVVILSVLGGSRFCSQRSQSPLQSSEHKVRKQRQQRRRNGSRQNHLVVDHGETAKNKFSESACADRRRDRCQPNGEHRRDSQSRDNDSRGERQLDLKEQLAIGESHGASRLDYRRIDAANARVSIANQRQQRIERKRQDRKPTSALSDPRRWKKKAEQGKARDGLDYVRAAKHRLAELRDARDQDAQRNSDQRREKSGDARQRHVLQCEIEHLLAIRHHELQEIHADHLMIISDPANRRTLPRMLARVDAASAKIPPLEGPR